VCAYYDIDTPVTFARLAEGCREFLTPELIRRYALYLSFTGGPMLRRIESAYGSPMARPLYCSVDPEQYRPCPQASRWDLGYLGTYSADRQPTLEQLLLEPARRFPKGNFTVVGPMYPDDIEWPANVSHEIHLSPREHAGFYGAQRFTLNLTREAMKQAGYSPSVRLFEAGACGAPIISDWWEGLDTLLAEEHEILIAHEAEDVLRYLHDYPETQRLALGAAARQRILTEHTPEQRAIQLEHYVKEVHDNFSAHQARRNGRSRQVADGVDAGLGPELARDGPSRETRRTAGGRSDTGGLHQPTRAGASNG
jgi:spore maturation protein CgeB